MQTAKCSIFSQELLNLFQPILWNTLKNVIKIIWYPIYGHKTVILMTQVSLYQLLLLELILNCMIYFCIQKIIDCIPNGSKEEWT